MCSFQELVRFVENSSQSLGHHCQASGLQATGLEALQLQLAEGKEQLEIMMRAPSCQQLLGKAVRQLVQLLQSKDDQIKVGILT